MDQIDRVMQEQTTLVEADAPKPAWDENDVLAIIEILEPAMTELATTPDGQLLMYPDWLMRTWLKMEIAGVLGYSTMSLPLAQRDLTPNSTSVDCRSNTRGR